jgi:hypothetical protein
MPGMRPVRFPIAHVIARFFDSSTVPTLRTV